MTDCHHPEETKRHLGMWGAARAIGSALGVLWVSAAPIMWF